MWWHPCGALYLDNELLCEQFTSAKRKHATCVANRRTTQIGKCGGWIRKTEFNLQLALTAAERVLSIRFEAESHRGIPHASNASFCQRSRTRLIGSESPLQTEHAIPSCVRAHRPTCWCFLGRIGAQSERSLNAHLRGELPVILFFPSTKLPATLRRPGRPTA